MDLGRDGPGLLLRDILKGEDPQIAAALRVIAALKPDILLLTAFDWDHDGVALAAFAERLAAAGVAYPHRFAPPSNAGLETGLDLDGDGQEGGPRDAQGYGRFAGDGAMALLSRWPLGEVRDFSALLWRDLPGAHLPVREDGTPFPSEEAQAIQRLSSTGHWVVPVEAPGGTVTVMAWAATPPVFDGPEDRNGRRAGDEAAFWLQLLDGAFGPPPEKDFVLMGLANLDPADGEGPREAIAALLADPRLQDPRPISPGGAADADPGQAGDPALDTADWDAAAEGGPGNLRVSYVLPSAGWQIEAAGVLWPLPGQALADDLATAGPHRPVWVDLTRPAAARSAGPALPDRQGPPAGSGSDIGIVSGS
ncbi:Endonuclease/Exonuclease/phosphatase family [Rubellimicrobium thermophilum DSM 16684]|uniref:Endonuclease/Exonuclease/phosphatase family n=1 Tax=Rubellimicrobium thermophilum DSM 16684 TaxID=1123069 RepID=S9R1M2_9RHOB|nr:endonuclease/exonuclease/phosphatase family protein [Rubellimicrobium thermophilum]EPX87551.1 Endonuclease/Exonuclease/phosphatase family [Rubellimicrobium thermophilum DSM 16684]